MFISMKTVVEFHSVSGEILYIFYIPITMLRGFFDTHDDNRVYLGRKVQSHAPSFCMNKNISPTNKIFVHDFGHPLARPGRGCYQRQPQDVRQNP